MTVTYASYLALDELLGAQHPVSAVDDELLFVVIHQTKELWLKQMIAELRAAKRLVRAGDLHPAYKHLARVSRIQAVMTLSWDVLATMTPTDYASFRGVLGSSSGFQSDQFRLVEFLLGVKGRRASPPSCRSAGGARGTKRGAARARPVGRRQRRARRRRDRAAGACPRSRLVSTLRPRSGDRGRLGGGLS